MKTLSYIRIKQIADIQPRINVSLIVSCLFALCLGLGLIVYAYTNSDDQMGMAGLFVGVTVAIASLAMILARWEQWVYMPSRSALDKKVLELDLDRFIALHARMTQVVPELRDVHVNMEKGRVLFECVYADDGQFVAFQLSQYTDLMFAPLMDVRTLTGNQAQGFVKLLKRELH